jgi:hypothetical protein
MDFINGCRLLCTLFCTHYDRNVIVALPQRQKLLSQMLKIGTHIVVAMPKSNTRGCGHPYFKMGFTEVFCQRTNYVSKIASQYLYYCNNNDFRFHQKCRSFTTAHYRDR